MKICWDNLEKIRYNSKNGMFMIKCDILHEYDACIECGYPFLSYRRNSIYCSGECQNKSDLHKKRLSISRAKRITSEETKRKMGDSSRKGDKHYRYDGGYSSNNIPKYDLFVNRLEPYEQCRRCIDDPNILEVKCTYCGKWFIPKLMDVNNRITGISTRDLGKFYCANECKQECPIYGKIKYYKGQEGYTSREVQPELRQLVFERDNYTCQKCGHYGGHLHCHHIDPVVSNPIESADMNNCITLCMGCHKEVHKLPGCGYDELRGCR